MVLDNHVPRVERTPWGVLCLVLDIIPLPGIGTIVAGVKTHDVKNIIFGILQAIIPVVGWLWGIAWGVLIFVNSTTTGSPSRRAARPA